jgi:hypothetical protein
MRHLLTTLTLLGTSAVTTLAAPTGSVTNHITGDYVEARTASVFAGACHYNGELTTTGREAEMAWHVRDGVWNGTSLNGLSAVASIVSEANLQDEQATRKAVLYIDAKATPAQADALTAALKTRYAGSLGTVVEVKRVPITYTQKAETYRVEAKGVTKLAVDAMPNHECCKQPNMVWYKPLVELKDRRVGFTRTSGIADKTLGTAWEKNNQNTAFYGTFAL